MGYEIVQREKTRRREKVGKEKTSEEGRIGDEER